MDEIWGFVGKKQKNASKADKREGIEMFGRSLRSMRKSGRLLRFLSLSVIPITRTLLSKTWRPG